MSGILTKSEGPHHGPTRVMASAPSVVQQARLMDDAGSAWHAVKCGNLELHGAFGHEAANPAPVEAMNCGSHASETKERTDIEGAAACGHTLTHTNPSHRGC
eukprot:GHUV01033742.1.p1 GENE.GHUV01033742.1~~GHUV01033742.1.p1  ORF type:complete len:102 (+),score=8.05 GHUV01033742.1:334-639(+)